MERRSKLLILIGIGLLLLAIGLWILFQPFLPQSQQPPALPETATPNTNVTTPTTAPVVRPPSQPTSPDLKQVEDLAASFVAREGSGSSAQGFLGYTDVLLNATPSYRETLKAEQLAMQRAHPAAGPWFGVVTRVVSTDSKGVVAGSSPISILVQVQRAEDAGNPSAPTSVTYQEATVTLEKQSTGGYLVSNVVWKTIQP